MKLPLRAVAALVLASALLVAGCSSPPGEANATGTAEEPIETTAQPGDGTATTAEQPAENETTDEQTTETAAADS